jgi:dihydrolipoamide dehydrogenase
MAMIMGEQRGLVKMVAEKKYGELLGVHIIGPHATTLIAEPTVALKLESTYEDIIHTTHSHPALAEALWEAALDVSGRALHAPPRRRGK